ncbi:unnamed protein product [Nezara viridula]|uniref:Uncharacterized protein n=1 Tax=Nezara viridula TaxID=85310 RepID=A0A9P0MRA3_NEZVI|nr:unnamed protein product [Nezara viridula]
MIRQFISRHDDVLQVFAKEMRRSRNQGLDGSRGGVALPTPPRSGQSGRGGVAREVTPTSGRPGRDRGLRQKREMSGEVKSTVRVAAPSLHEAPPPKRPGRSPFAIQELLGLAEPPQQEYPRHPSLHTQAMLSASRMAYFNAQAAVAAAFLPQPQPPLHPPPPSGMSYLTLG